MQENIHLSSEITSWANMTKDETTTKKQHFRKDSLLLCKKRKIMIKIADRKKIEVIQKKITEQIFQKIVNMSTEQRNLIISLCKLKSKDISLHAISSNARANLKRNQEWAKKIANLTCISRRFFAVLTHKIHITTNTSNQKVLIERLIKDNAKLHKNLKILRIVWLKKIAKSKKAHSLFIVKIAIEAIINQLINMSMLNAYYECKCKLFKKNCWVTQCFWCHKFDYMIRFCRKNQHCIKCANKHYIKKCMTSLNKRRCVNCNKNHELWRCICFKWWQQMKQAFEIYRNRSFKYSETFKYNCTLL